MIVRREITGTTVGRRFQHPPQAALDGADQLFGFTSLVGSGLRLSVRCADDLASVDAESR
jgi:hypothetical protein